jgi:hypothetical protein
MQIVRLGTHSSRTDESPLNSVVSLDVDAENNIITGTWVDSDLDTVGLSGDGVIIYKQNENLDMIWTEEFDGTNDEQIVDIEIQHDRIFAVGTTTSYDIPVKNAIGYAYQEFGDIFIFELTSSGELIFSSYLGGNFWDFPSIIRVDEGMVTIGGITSSTEFLGHNIDLNGYSDAFLLQLDLSDARYNLPVVLGIFLEQTSVFEWIILIASVIFVSRALSYYSIFRYLEYLILSGLVLSFTLSIFSYYLSFVLDNFTQNLMILNKPIALLSVSMILIQIHAYRTKWDSFPNHLVGISIVLLLMKLVSPLFIVLESGEELSAVLTILPVVLYSLFDIYTIGLLLYAYLTFDLYNPVPRARRLHKIWIAIWIVFAIGIVVLLFFTSLELWLITQQDLSDHIVQVNLYRDLIFIYQSGIYIVLTFLAIGIIAISYPEGLVLSQTQFIRALNIYKDYRRKQTYPQAEEISETRLMSYIRNAEKYMANQ